MPAYVSLQHYLTKGVVALFHDRRYADAEKALRQLVTRFPTWPVHHYNLAAALARQNKREAALESLDTAIGRGFRNMAAMEQDPDLESLRALPRFHELRGELARQSKPTTGKVLPQFTPKRVQAGRAIVDGTNTAWESRSNTLISAFDFTNSPKSKLVHSGDDSVSRLLNGWYESGNAAGNHGDLYDNRDDGHSRLSKAMFPQLAHVVYGAEARAAKIHYGLNSYLLYNAITFGNSSTALTGGRLWRSQARLALTNVNLVARAYRQYVNNHLYVYPEHRDHDIDHGDLLPANTPYMIISQGSSGSDQPFLRALGAILAAFRPDVKALLRKQRLVMPTVQMILRQGQKPVSNDADYLSAKAHPTVFSRKNIDLVRMIELANNLNAKAVPPMVTLKVVEEDSGVAGIDYFGPATIGERLFDTPSAIARLIRSTRYMRRIVVSARDTKDPNSRPLRFHWVVLRGDTDRIKITPSGPRNDKAEIQIPWHGRHPVPTAPKLQTDRVDIGVFADNGEKLSAPAFISFLYPGDQKRSYDERGRLRCVDYNDLSFRKRYVDPLLFPARDWRDCYENDEAGKLIGWNRISGGSVARFTWDGAKVVRTDDDGRPVLAEKIRYVVEATKSGRPRIVQLPTGTYQAYRYHGAADRIGESEPAVR